jgi:hypothetical protein
MKTRRILPLDGAGVKTATYLLTPAERSLWFSTHFAENAKWMGHETFVECGEE